VVWAPPAQVAARLQIASVSCTNEWCGRNLRHKSNPILFLPAVQVCTGRVGTNWQWSAAQLEALTPPGNGRSSNNTRALAAMHAPTTNAAAGPPTIQITPALALAPNAVTPIATSDPKSSTPQPVGGGVSDRRPEQTLGDVQLQTPQCCAKRSPLGGVRSNQNHVRDDENDSADPKLDSAGSVVRVCRKDGCQ
jgi:hypothetical protein